MNCARAGFLVVTVAFCMVLSAQRVIPQPTSMSTFASSDEAFRFDYSHALVSCRRHPTQVGHWVPDDSCNAYTPVCSNFSGDSAETVACVAYPASDMKGTNFQAAAFAVNELKEATTEAECLHVPEPPPHVGEAQIQMLNGAAFTVVETDGVATGNLIDSYVYRTFHQNKCYELDIRIAYSKPANAEPGMMKSFDSAEVRGRLEQVLETFRFSDSPARNAQLRAVKIKRPNIVIRGAYLGRVEVWAEPSGTEITEDAYYRVGTAKRTNHGGGDEVWIFPITCPSTWIISTSVFVKAFDASGSYVATKSLPYFGVTDVANALCACNSFPDRCR
jgi:hypothetical protein